MNNENDLEYYESLSDEIESELDEIIENLIFMLETNEISDINLYNIYLEITELLNNKKMIQDKIRLLKIMK